MSANNKPYINIGNQQYDNRLPPYYDSIEDKQLIDVLESNASVFINEWEQYMQQYKQRSKFFLLYKEKGWNTTMLYSYGLRYHKNCSSFPKTLRLLQSYSNIVTVYFSTLEPGTKLNPHFGDTDATYRIHLGLHIPAGLPLCGIEVGGIQKAWQNDKTIIFNDAHYHTAWNLTDKDRTVLIIDMIRPELAQQKWWIVPQILGALGMGRLLFFWRNMKIPGFILQALHFTASVIFMAILPLQRMLRFFINK